jgi:hypothetical protein
LTRYKIDGQASYRGLVTCKLIQFANSIRHGQFWQVANFMIVQKNLKAYKLVVNI